MRAAQNSTDAEMSAGEVHTELYAGLERSPKARDADVQLRARLAVPVEAQHAVLDGAHCCAIAALTCQSLADVQLLLRVLLPPEATELVVPNEGIDQTSPQTVKFVFERDECPKSYLNGTGSVELGLQPCHRDTNQSFPTTSSSSSSQLRPRSTDTHALAQGLSLSATSAQR